MVAKRAGMPAQILDAYTRYMENMVVRNTIGKGIGQPYTRRCGIPQGSPLSMMFIALQMRPWVIAMRGIGAIPRILADDLMIITTGVHHCASMEKAINLTHCMLHNMGATVAPDKSYIFTNRQAARRP